MSVWSMKFCASDVYEPTAQQSTVLTHVTSLRPLSFPFTSELGTTDHPGPPPVPGGGRAASPCADTAAGRNASSPSAQAIVRDARAEMCCVNVVATLMEPPFLRQRHFRRDSRW